MHGQTSAHARLAMLGLAAFFAWFSLAAIGTPTLLSTATDETVAAGTGLLFFAAMFAGAGVVKLTGTWFAKHVLSSLAITAFAACCAAPALYLCLCAPWGIEVPVFAVLEFAGGIGCAFLLVSWQNAIAQTRPESFARLESAAFVIGSIAASALLAAAFNSGDFSLVCCALASLAALAACCTVLLALRTRFESAAAHPSGKLTKKDVSGHMDKRFRALFFILNFAFGLSWFAIPFNVLTTAVAFTCGSAVMLAFALFLRTRLKIFDRHIVNLMRASLCTVLVSYLLMFTGYPLAAHIALGALVALWGLCWIIDNALLQQQAVEFGLSVTEHGAASKVINAAGFAAGWTTGCAVTLAATVGMDVRIQGWAAVAVFVALAGAWLLPFSTYDSPDMILAKQADLARERARIERAADSESAQIAKAVKRYRLTARERDTIVWLMRGKTAKRIAEELGVSVPTAKSHTYNIYKKTGVHTQQELRELLEAL